MISPRLLTITFVRVLTLTLVGLAVLGAASVPRARAPATVAVAYACASDSSTTSVEPAPLVSSGTNQISGVVRGPDGNSVKGARVTAIAGAGGRVDEFLSSLDPSTWSKTEGEFRIAHLEEGSYTLIATWKPPESTSSSVVLLPWKARLDGIAAGASGVVLVLDPGSTILGRALDDAGEALRQFHVVLTHHLHEEDCKLLSWGIDPNEIRCDDGHFEIHGLENGPCYLHVVADDHVGSTPVRLNLPAETAPITFVVPRGARLRGIVVDASGAPVAGARVSARSPDERGLAFFEATDVIRVESGAEEHPRKHSFELHPSEEPCFSGTDGRFELTGVRPGAAILRAVALEQAPSVPRTLELAAGKTVEDLRIVLRRGATIHGVVRDAEGKPLAGIDVGVIVDHDSEWHTTGADGAFRFEHVAPAPIVLAAREDLPPGAASRLQPDVIERTFSPDEGEDVEVALGGLAAHTVHITGVLSGSASVAYAKVRFTPNKTGSEYVQAKANAAGEYALDLVERGSYWVTLLLASDSKAEREVQIGDGERQVIDLKLPGTLLRGRVVDDHGLPLVAQLRLRRTDLESSDGGWSTVTTDRTEKDGTFVFEGLDRGPWRMSVTAATSKDGPSTPATKFASIDLTSQSTVEGLVVRLERGGAIEGVVRGPDGKPVAGARVTARGEDGFDFDHETPAEERVATNAAGHYAIEGLAPGTWQVRAVTAADASPESTALHVESGSRAKADLVLARAVFLEVRLEDAQGNVLRHGANQWTRVIDAQGRAWVDLEDERYGVTVRELGPLPAGKWTVRRGDGRKFPAVELALAPGDRKSVTLRAVE